MMLYICNQSQHIWEQFQFSCEVAQCGKTLVSVFQEFFPGIAGFQFGGWAGRWAIILWGFGTLLIFPNFLRSFP